MAKIRSQGILGRLLKVKNLKSKMVDFRLFLLCFCDARPLQLSFVRSDRVGKLCKLGCLGRLGKSGEVREVREVILGSILVPFWVPLGGHFGIVFGGDF